MQLADRIIKPLPQGSPALEGAKLEELLDELRSVGTGWDPSGGKLRKTFKFPDFKSALAFVDQVGAMADQVDHHPDIELSWGKATIQIWTHTVGGLAEIDFVFAARCEQIYSSRAPGSRSQ